MPHLPLDRGVRLEDQEQRRLCGYEGVGELGPTEPGQEVEEEKERDQMESTV